MFACFRPLWLPVALGCLCCSCTKPEERADTAFAQLTESVVRLRAELAAVTDAESAALALPTLSAHVGELRDILARLDELAEDPDLPPEARRRVGEQHHESLRRAVDDVLREGQRLARRALYHADGLNRLARQELAHYSTRGVHPWPRAVLAGKEYRGKK